jgi:glucose/arabinose dehydrogenase
MIMQRFRIGTLSASAAILLVACGGGAGPSSVPAPPTPAPGQPAPTPAPTQPTPAPAQPAGLSLVPVLEGFDRPLLVTAPSGDPRLFVVEQTGRIEVVSQGSVGEEPFLDLTERVACCGERGLLGLAFHPEYESNGRFFVHYSDLDGDTTVEEYARSGDDPDRAVADPVALLLAVRQPFGNHNGGSIAFGPDGFLYVGLGDGGAAGDPLDAGQNAENPLGSILRLDVDAPDRQVAGNFPGGANGVWAIGLRNPWRFAFDRATGDLYIADVGQFLWEEVNVAPAGVEGLNFGWATTEGLQCYRPPESCEIGGLTAPIFVYGREEGCSVTGGHVYRGGDAPSLYGWYVFGDFCSNRVWALRWSEGALEEQMELTDMVDPEGRLRALSSFGEGSDGELYAVSLDGMIWRFEQADQP